MRERERERERESGIKYAVRMGRAGGTEGHIKKEGKGRVMISSKRRTILTIQSTAETSCIRQPGREQTYIYSCIYTYRKKIEEKETQGWETKENSPWTRV